MNTSICFHNNIPVSYALDLELVTAKYIEKHHTIDNGNESSSDNLVPNPSISSTIRRSAIYTLSGIASPFAGTLGCLRNTVTCEPKAAFFDLVNGIKNLFFRSVFTPLCNCLCNHCCCGSRGKCYTGPHTVDKWFETNERFHYFVLTQKPLIDPGLYSCYNCYPEINRDNRYEQRMSFIRRSYFKFANYSNRNLILSTLQEAIRKHDQPTIDFLELNHFFQNKGLFIELAKLFLYFEMSNTKIYTRIALYLFLKNNPLFIYEFEAYEELERKEFSKIEFSEQLKLLEPIKLKPLEFSQFITIHKYQEIRSLIHEHIKQQINKLEEIDKFHFPTVLESLIAEYAAPIGIALEGEKSYLPSYQNEDSPEYSQEME